MIGDQKKTRIIIGTSLALVVAILIGIAYAAFTGTLTISGTATVEGSTWDVHFANLGPVDGQGNVIGYKTGTAVQLTAPSIKNSSGVASLTGTTINNYVVSLTTPGDKISYIFDVVNNGDYNVGISSVGSIDQNGNIVTPVCKVGNDDTAESAVNVCKHLKYTLKYYDKTNSVALNTAVGTYTPSSTDPSVFNSSDPNGIAAHSSVSMILTLEYVDFTVADDGQGGTTNVAGAESDLPTQNVSISNLGFNIVYTQIGNSVPSN